MAEYLIGIMYHEPEPFAQWKRGLIEDYESSTGLFVEAESPEDARAWGEQVGQALLRFVNNDETLNWEATGYICWIEESPGKSGWGHCLAFFQHVRVGQWPAIAMMTTEAYRRWLEKSQI